MNINNLPDELLDKILKHVLPDKSCNIEEFKNYFLVNKVWCKILNSNTMLCAFSQKNNLYKQYKNEIFTYLSLINRLCIDKLIFKINPVFLTIMSMYDIINLPFCKFTNSKCIDGLCHLDKSCDCYFNHHNIYNYITNPIMRGLDDLGRIYILFCYKNTETNIYNYEFIYHKTINDEIFLTYSGEYKKTYIGMMSDNKIADPDYIFERELNIYSHNYMRKLINNEGCGVPLYDSSTQTFVESDDSFITLYY
jgi:hypothetical protein